MTEASSHPVPETELPTRYIPSNLGPAHDEPYLGWQGWLVAALIIATTIACMIWVSLHRG